MAFAAFLFLLFLSPLSLFCTAVSLPAQEDVLQTIQRATVMPDEDSFYKPPPGFESTAPGSILRYRPVPNPITLNNKDAIKPKAAWQILYRTQNSIGKPIATVITVLQPHNAKRNSLFGYNFFSDASYNGCNPSITLQVGTRSDNTFNQLQNGLVVAALGRGWYVSVADDGGPQAAFGSGLQNAYAQLDGFRAVKQSGAFTGLGSDPTITMYGYSGGGVSVAWTSELQPIYAPELKLAGAALGGLVPNMTRGLELYNKAERAKLSPPAILGLSHDFPNMSIWLNDNLVPELASEFRKADSQCFDSNEKMFAYQDLGKYFKRGYNSLFDPIPKSVMFAASAMGVHAIPKIPWYLYETIWDDASPVELTDALADKYCRGGQSIHYERNSIVKMNHSEECIWGLPGAFQWLQDRHDRRPLSIQSGCKVQNYSDYSIRAMAGGVLFKGIFDNLFAMAGLQVKNTIEPTTKLV